MQAPRAAALPFTSGGGVLSPPQSASTSSRTYAYLHSGVRVAGSLLSAVCSTTSPRPSGVRVPRRSADVAGAAYSAQSGRVSGAAPHSGPGGAPQPRPPS
ncbi:hypothetical protein NDU88_005806 [Pleurodeles waltl]|uniref:Uncharacterized protein n=1 Tax=Pleurodeles waltl TaxID=8319 RepID=A0AAV7TBT7_PLEWA|nr:hypothetical protein NDU88_005806 [Pleurodeles waltl]